MANLKNGIYGEYYGSPFGDSESLSDTESKVNALYIYLYLHDKGWSLNAISGILGNMQHESALNPGRWQSNNVGNYSGGYGLVQWTPATKYIDWCQSEGIAPEDMDSNLARILYEVENRVQWYATNDYDFSFKTFTTSTESPYYLACAFAWNYERSATVLYGTDAEKEALRQKRGGSANFWYEYISGEDPDIPDIPDDPDIPDIPPGTTLKKKKFNFLLFTARKRRSTWTKTNF